MDKIEKVDPMMFNIKDLYDPRIVNIIKNLLKSDTETFLINSGTNQQTCLNLLVLVAASSESPIDKETMELLDKLVKAIRKLSAITSFSTPIKGKNLKEIEDSPSTSKEENPPRVQLDNIDSEHNDNIRIVIAHSKGYNWNPEDNLKQLIQFKKENKRIYHHLKDNLENDTIYKITQLTDKNIEVIFADFKMLLLGKETNEIKISELINYFIENYLEHINENLFIRKIKTKEDNYTITVYTKREEIYNDIKRNKWTIKVNNDQYRFYQKTKYKICMKCKTAFSGGHIRCSLQ